VRRSEVGKAEPLLKVEFLRRTVPLMMVLLVWLLWRVRRFVLDFVLQSRSTRVDRRSPWVSG